MTLFLSQIGEIQGHVVAEDVNNDGRMDLVAADSNGNVVCYSRDGDEQWHRRISGFASQASHEQWHTVVISI